MTLLIQQATVFTPQQTLADGAVLVENGRLTAVGPTAAVPQPANAQVINANGRYLIPGLIDLQLNGGFGHDFTLDPATIWPVAQKLPQFGATSFLPTIITAPLAASQQAMAVLAQGPPPGWRGAQPLGLHLEGPYLNPGKKGAHNPAHLREPNLAEIANWSAATGVRLVTLAPELPGALDMVRALVERGVVVSAGHSLATYTEALAGFAAGIRYGTHLFNAMPPLLHRDPGLAGALLTDDRLTIGLIPDGVHVHPALLKIVWQAVGNGRLNIVTDAMAAMGMPPGCYQLGDHTVFVDENQAQLADGTLAGSIISLDTALRRFIHFTGCSLAAALPTFTITPARLLGLGEQKGQIAPGYDADLVLLTPSLTVVQTLVAGELVYEANEAITD